MASLTMDRLRGLFQRPHKSKKREAVFANAREAYEFSRRVYKETGGPTADLKRVYQTFLQSQAGSEKVVGPAGRTPKKSGAS
jgi:hypothetical protein